MTLTIRRADGTDAQTLSVLAADTFTETFGHLYPPEDLRGYLESGYRPSDLHSQIEAPDTLWLLAERGGQAVGFVQAGPCKLPHPEAKATDGELKRLYVRRQLHGTGTGTRLLEQALSFLDGRNTDPQWVGVYSDNVGAQRLYARYGFKKAGEYEFAVGKMRDREFIYRRRR